MMRLAALAAAVAAVAAGNPPYGALVGVEPITNTGIGMRHCNYVVQATPIETGSADFQFHLVAALNGASSCLSALSFHCRLGVAIPLHRRADYGIDPHMCARASILSLVYERIAAGFMELNLRGWVTVQHSLGTTNSSHTHQCPRPPLALQAKLTHTPSRA